ncbi:heptaprenyl diphosphate synthase component II [Paenibacillus sp. N3.4]|uniref:heptaprenyl diphosphate synthase component II n=1 Tax=Paenibacillus sp. N3.4 TaxID=2603222 RepID=UPI0011C9A106|nr:heptaprenyl diphosphate synthase component II [Paenibacillus sp. N3.4]TXK81409.1 heptaprenyl diphosphate synthase component II [Paenibacillus sp. N3.4]
MKNLMDIYTRKKKDIAAIEKELEESIHADHSMLRDTSLHLLKAGGKRIRPVFVLLSGEFGDYQLQTMKHVAVPLELIHMASLVHDDVIDDANTRRGQLTVRSKWDNRIAMFTGDFIFAKALGVITEIPNPTVHQIMSKAIVEMSIGEMEQIRFFFHADQTIRDYLLRIRRKTALLIAISCQLGAVAANAPDWISNKLYTFGYNIGMVFQIRDDILDLIGTEKQIGKPPGSDVKQGNITLPVLFALEDRSLRPHILTELERIQEADGQTEVSKLLDMIRSSDGIQRADALSQKYMDKAIASLDKLPDIQAKKDLIEVAYFISNRSY